MPAARGIAGGARVAIEDQAETEMEGEAEDSGTGRLEAFSDGVFAIAVTLLVLQLKVPDVPFKKSLASFVVGQWPAFVAYFNSFLSILIMWLNHHNIFKQVRRSNHTFIIFNGVLLMLITFLNYPTALLAPALKVGTDDDKKFATLVYTGTFVVIAVFYNVLWRYGTHNGRLLSKHANKALVAQITREYRFGPLVYLVAFLLAFVSVPASLVLTVLLAVYFALSGRNRSGRAPQAQGTMP
jgi:TMEM175 potassium channel family protein